VQYFNRILKGKIYKKRGAKQIPQEQQKRKRKTKTNKSQRERGTLSI